MGPSTTSSTAPTLRRPHPKADAAGLRPGAEAWPPARRAVSLRHHFVDRDPRLPGGGFFAVVFLAFVFEAAFFFPAALFDRGFFVLVGAGFGEGGSASGSRSTLTTRARPALLKKTTLSGGRVTSTENGWPWLDTSVASTPPKLPCPWPQYS